MKLTRYRRRHATEGEFPAEMKHAKEPESDLLRRMMFLARYEASAVGAEQVEWPHLFLGLLRDGTSVQNFLGSHEAVNGLRLKVTETLPVARRVSTSLEIPISAECRALVAHADQQALGKRRPQAALEILFVNLLKNQPEWFRQFGLDSDAFAAALAYPPLSSPDVKSMQLTGVPAVMFEFRGVLDELETVLRPMPEERAGEPSIPGTAWSRKQTIGFLIDSTANLHQICIRTLVGQSPDISFLDYDPEAWVMAAGYQEMSWRVLMDLCVTYNRLVYDLCDHSAAARLDHAICRIGDKPARPLLDILHDHVANVRRRLKEVAV